MNNAVTLGAGLFAVQVVYKLLIVAAVGRANPAVATNVSIAILHSISLAVMLMCL